MKTWFEKVYGEPPPVKQSEHVKVVSPVVEAVEVKNEPKIRAPRKKRKRRLRKSKPVEPRGVYDPQRAAEYLKSLKA